MLKQVKLCPKTYRLLRSSWSSIFHRLRRKKQVKLQFERKISSFQLQSEFLICCTYLIKNTNFFWWQLAMAMSEDGNRTRMVLCWQPNLTTRKNFLSIILEFRFTLWLGIPSIKCCTVARKMEAS